jgi:hypothetical protein
MLLRDDVRDALVQTPNAVALSAATCVAAYVTAFRGLVLGDVEFALCASVLVLALLLVFRRTEGFADSVSSMTDTYIVGPLDRLIKGMDKGIADGPFEKTQNVTGEHVSAYRKLGGLLCRLDALDAPRFARLRETLGVAPPEMEEQQEQQAQQEWPPKSMTAS